MALVVSMRPATQGCVLESGAGDLCGVDDAGCDEVFVLLGRCAKAIAFADLSIIAGFGEKLLVVGYFPL
jgi:hypothetical protein